MSDALARRLAALEGAEAALVLSSGTAAMACALLALLRPGDHLLASNRIRRITRAFLEQELPSLGVRVTFIDPRDTRGWRRGLERTTRALLLETPAFDEAFVVDCQPPRALARELGIALLVDSTAASPVLFRPLQHGADVVLHDASFLLHGAGGSAAGVVCGSEGLVEEVRAKMWMWGGIPHPRALDDLQRELETLEVRVLRQSASAQAVMRWSQDHPAVREVIAPGLVEAVESDPASAVRSGTHLGGITLLLALDTPERAIQVRERLHEHFPVPDSPWPGTHTTLVERAEDPAMLRMRIGLETSDLLIGRLTEALA